MAETTGISWCDATINFWHGCKKVSEGCKFCYMFRDKDRYNQDGSQVIKTKKQTIDRTLHALRIEEMKRATLGINEPLKIFTCSWSDFFIEEADDWREEAWDVIRNNRQYIWIILTKRPERMEQCFPADWGEGWDNVWLIVSAENQERFDERVPILAQTRAKKRGVSIEPMIGPVDIQKAYPTGKGQVYYGLLMDWIIVGGESGNDTGKWNYRPAKLEWFVRIVADCDFSSIPVFVKQLGTSISKEFKLKSKAGDNLEEWPERIEYLKKQQFP